MSMVDILNRRVKVEKALEDYAKKGTSCPPTECHRLARLLGVPTVPKINDSRPLEVQIDELCEFLQGMKGTT